ncbi:recombinase family protein [Aggregatilinea lenta]|uniref:recombinase family protein n=1 Tax=Aggregatilinea lenta TaxID=913108 RepID=UPI0013C36A80|nr:recombinase family protein [Aggregatilinea lenta]
MSSKRRVSIERNVALCYIRQSFTRDENDKTSPERQHALAQALVEAEGWTAEWYEDVEGHKSGRSEKNRPEWLRLKRRLGDPDVVALVTLDLARIHRKGWRIGDLLEQVDRYGVQLVFTAPGYSLDLSSFNGRFLAQITAMLDEAYAEDVSRRTKSAVAYLKAQGKNVGRPPFGTMRNEEGYLAPSPDGAWFLPDSGLFQKGKLNQPPTEDALWRSYYDCARHILDLYAENEIGMDKIAYKMNTEGWAFRDRKGNPRPVAQDDVRRVVANWPEYGGLVPENRAKDRPAYEDEIDPLRLIEDRAVFPLPLLRKVAAVRKERSLQPSDSGIKREARIYPLSGLLYCVHCDKRAEEQQDPRLRERLTGLVDPRGKRRYKHTPGVQCGCTNRTVPAEDVERDFGRLLKLLTIKPEAAEHLATLSLYSRQNASDADAVDLEQQRQEGIALCQRRIDAAVHLYGDGRISRDEYLRRVEANEREIAHWEAYTNEAEQKALEMTRCIEAVNQIAAVWDTSDDEDKRGMAHYLFSEIVYNLDTRRIESYKLKPWADDFLMLRMELYYDEFGDLTEGSEGYQQALEKEHSNELLGCWNAMPHRGCRGQKRSFVERSIFTSRQNSRAA